MRARAGRGGVRAPGCKKSGLGFRLKTPILRDFVGRVSQCAVSITDVRVWRIRQTRVWGLRVMYPIDMKMMSFIARRATLDDKKMVKMYISCVLSQWRIGEYYLPFILY